MSQLRPRWTQPILGLIFWEPLFKPDSAPALSWTVGERPHFHIPCKPEARDKRIGSQRPSGESHNLLSGHWAAQARGFTSLGQYSPFTAWILS